MKHYQDVLKFWFGEGPNLEQNKEVWFKSNEEIDNKIRASFKETLFLAKKSKLNEWKKEPLGRLALIILCDQFSRNIYRRRAEAFGFDDIALENCLEGRKQKQDVNLALIQKHFFYMPLMHSEDLAVQKIALEVFGKLAKEQDNEQVSKYAKLHYDIIAKYGRFPHRNEVLARQSTPEELNYLKSAERFGQ